MSARWGAADEALEQLEKLTLRQEEDRKRQEEDRKRQEEDRKRQEEDRKQQAQRNGEVLLQMDALNAELNRASQTSQAEADIGKVCFPQMLLRASMQPFR